MGTPSDLKVLLTGDKGFIGTIVFNYLQENGVHPDGFDMGDEFPSKKYDFIIHLAARTLIRKSREMPYEYFSDGLGLTMKFLEKARKDSSVFVFATSGSIEEATNPYSLSKKQGIEWINLYRNLYGIRALLLKFFNIYGESSRKGAVYLFCNAAVSGLEATIYGDGNHVRDYTHVSDVARLILRIVKGEVGPGDHEVGTGRGTSVNELLAKVEEISGVKLVRKHEDYVLPEGESLVAQESVLVDPVPVEEGIKRVLSTLKAEKVN